MYQDKFIFLILAPSGAGKDTIVNKLCKNYNFTKVKSYTTRPQRKNDNTDINNHIFITEKEYQNIVNTQNVVATTTFNNFHYCATQEQVEKSDFYIVDIHGLKTFMLKYKGDKKIKVIGIDCLLSDREERMKKRGDNAQQISERLSQEHNTFYHWRRYLDVIFTNNKNSLNRCCKQIKEYIDNLIISERYTLTISEE